MVFVNDILIYSRSEEEHERHLRIILNVLRRNQLRAKFSKCHFWRKEVRFLGQVVYEVGLAVDPGKVVAVKYWKVPKNASEVHSFLGPVGFYRKFIKDFAKISSPLTKLTKKNLVYA